MLIKVLMVLQSLDNLSDNLPGSLPSISKYSISLYNNLLKYIPLNLDVYVWPTTEKIQL